MARGKLEDARGGLLTLITVTLISSGLGSTDRIGLVLLLCPGVELALLALKCELSRWGNGKRTMAEEGNGRADSGAVVKETAQRGGGNKQEYAAEEDNKWAQIRVLVA